MDSRGSKIDARDVVAHVAIASHDQSKKRAKIETVVRSLSASTGAEVTHVRKAIDSARSHGLVHTDGDELVLKPSKWPW
jgi:hypothetical protein